MGEPCRPFGTGPLVEHVVLALSLQVFCCNTIVFCMPAVQVAVMCIAAPWVVARAAYVHCRLKLQVTAEQLDFCLPCLCCGQPD